MATDIDRAARRPPPAGVALATDAIIFAAFVALIGFIDHAPGLLTALLVVVGVLRLTSSRGPNEVLIFAVAMIGGAGFDLLRVGLGTYEYAGYVAFPPFMPLLWGHIGLTIHGLLVWVDERSAADWTRPLPRVELLATAVVLLISVFGLHLVDDRAGWAIAIYLGSFGAFVMVVRRPGDLELGLAMMLLGPLAELALVSTGLYRFDTGRIWGLPPWLPAVWPLYALLLRRARGVMVERRSPRWP